MTEDLGKMHESGNAKSAANCVERPPHREGNVALFIQRWLLVKCKWTSPGGFMLSWRTKKLSIVLHECVSKISHTGWADKREALLTLQPLGRTELGEADVCYQINILLTGGIRSWVLQWKRLVKRLSVCRGSCLVDIRTSTITNERHQTPR